MNRRTSRLLGLCLFGLLLLPLAPSSSAEAGDGWWGDLDKGQVVELRDIVAKPRSFRGKQLTFFCIVRGPDNVFFPQNRLLSRTRYANFTVWPDGTPLWDAAAYANSEFPTLYISRTHPDQATLMRVPRYTRIEVTGSVRALVGRRPCIEIASWRESGHRLGRDVVDSVVRARAFVRGGDARLARSNFREAMAVDLPSNYRVLIEEEARRGLESLGSSMSGSEPAGTPAPTDDAIDPDANPFDTPTPAPTPASGGTPPSPGSVAPPSFDSPQGPASAQPAAVDPTNAPPPTFDSPLPGTSPAPTEGAAPPPGDDFLDDHLGPNTAPPSAAGNPEGAPDALPAPQPARDLRPGQAPPTRRPKRATAPTTPPKRGAPPKRRPRLVGVR